jgi:hypothetical protein
MRWHSGWGTALHTGRSRARFPMVSLDFFHWHNPSDRTMALGSTQPLTEMSTRNIYWVVKGWQPCQLHVPRCTRFKGLPQSVITQSILWFVRDNFTLKCYIKIAQYKSTIAYKFMRSLNYKLSIRVKINIDWNFSLFQVNSLENSGLHSFSRCHLNVNVMKAVSFINVFYCIRAKCRHSFINVISVVIFTPFLPLDINHKICKD